MDFRTTGSVSITGKRLVQTESGRRLIRTFDKPYQLGVSSSVCVMSGYGTPGFDVWEKPLVVKSTLWQPMSARRGLKQLTRISMHRV